MRVEVSREDCGVPVGKAAGDGLGGTGEGAQIAVTEARGAGRRGRFSKVRVAALVVVLVVAGMALGGAAVWGYLSPLAVSRAPVGYPVSVASVVEEVAAGTVTAVYNQVAPAVVRVEATRVSGGWLGAQSEESTGSGVIVDANGYVLTNYHVVQGATEVKVTLVDGATVDGKVTGTDPGNDLAVVKINPAGHDVRAAVLGDSDRVQVGELAIAIGNPFGLDRTLTVGVISGKDRQMTGVTGRTIRGLLQTDAAINPGNSGGPLLNARGEVIGINTAIESPVSGSVGIGFAVPINTARRSLPLMVSGGQVEHPWLGIAGTGITPDVADRLHLGSRTGVLVTEVMEGSPASGAGLRPLSVTPSGRTLVGDIITAVDGRAVASVDDISRYLETKRPGDRVTLTVLRDGVSVQLNVTLAAWPERLPRQGSAPSWPGTP
ncbi:MAG: trypsin-like peptidase domain-containing protein [Bacillota bacterium]|nr:trypsin-like peptidase domain-containing protein [Bacillota bacterium]